MQAKTQLLSALCCAGLMLPAVSLAAPIMIDVNDADIDGTGAGTDASPTAAGWTGLDVAHTGNGGTVTVDGIAFSVGSSDGARLRGSIASPDPDALYGDFAFDDGAGEAIIMFFGGAGDLAAGTWEVSIYSFDTGGNAPGTQIAGFRANNAETIVDSNVQATSSGPAITFQFVSDGTSAYDVFLRENSDNNRTRLNAVTLELVPEPSSIALLGLGLVGLTARRRRNA